MNYQDVKPTKKVQAVINWGALTTVLIGFFAAIFPDIYSKFPPATEAALVAFISSLAGWFRVE